MAICRHYSHNQFTIPIPADDGTRSRRSSIWWCGRSWRRSPRNRRRAGVDKAEVNLSRCVPPVPGWTRRSNSSRNKAIFGRPRRARCSLHSWKDDMAPVSYHLGKFRHAASIGLADPVDWPGECGVGRGTMDCSPQFQIPRCCCRRLQRRKRCCRRGSRAPRPRWARCWNMKLEEAMRLIRTSRRISRKF